MLTVNDNQYSTEVADETMPSSVETKVESSNETDKRFEKILSVEWLGQTLASLCWIGSVFVYGITSSGDWLQLCAASSWLLANIASAMPAKNH
jgi:hypothetical protein|tara:strand:+ start:923 stop:1201 length:279 start_codon:yes stop_codon:yes gene_type:complete